MYIILIRQNIWSCFLVSKSNGICKVSKWYLFVMDFYLLSSLIFSWVENLLIYFFDMCIDFMKGNSRKEKNQFKKAWNAKLIQIFSGRNHDEIWKIATLICNFVRDSTDKRWSFHMQNAKLNLILQFIESYGNTSARD